MTKTWIVVAVALALGIVGLVVSCERGHFSVSNSGEQDSGAKEDAGANVPSIAPYQATSCTYMIHPTPMIESGMSQPVFAQQDQLDHIHTGAAASLENSFVINWRSKKETLSSEILISKTKALLEPANGAMDGVRQISGHHMLVGDETRIHEVHACGLDPDTQYFYKVGGPGAWSSVFAVTTAPLSSATANFKFGVTGDTRDAGDPSRGDPASWPRAEKLLYDEGIDFQIFTGDAVMTGTVQEQWNRWFEADIDGFEIETLLSGTPIFLVNGNHDVLATNYIAQFAFPQQQDPGERANGEEWYSFTYGNAFFLMLNDTVASTSAITEGQVNFMRRELSRLDRSKIRWIFVGHHKPLYTCQSRHSPNMTGRIAWQPVIDEFGIDIVFSGHNHAYERSKAIRGINATAEPVTVGGSLPTYEGLKPSGTLYVTAAGLGPELYPVGTDCPTSHTAQSLRSYVTVEIQGDRLSYVAKEVHTGEILDQFELNKTSR